MEEGVFASSTVKLSFPSQDAACSFVNDGAMERRKMGRLRPPPKSEVLVEKAAKASATKPIRLPSRFEHDVQGYRFVSKAKGQASTMDKTRKA